MGVRACLDAVVRAIHLTSEATAFLLGFPLVLVLHCLHFLTSEPINRVRDAAFLAAQGARASVTTPVAATPAVTTDLAERLRTRGLPRNPSYTFATQQARGPALYPPTAHAAGNTGEEEDTSLHDHHALLGSLEDSALNLADRLLIRMSNMASRVEEQGGLPSHLLGRLRKRTGKIEASLVRKLPPEINTQILLFAASPSASRPIPCKIAMLSKAHYRLVVSRLYKHVHLADATTFRHFRMTMAVHNPELGKHLRSLAVASAAFDAEGYLPDQVSEHTTLGVGIEQILLTAPNLQHLYLDLFSLAALHHSTASRLEKGSLPLSLTTEFSLPQYLTLPTFAHLQHVELVVFALDSNAVDWFRQVLPRLQTLTIRWVTRWGRPQRRVSPLATIAGSNRQATFDDEEDDQELDEEERRSWQDGGRQHLSLVEFLGAIENLRRWPHHCQETGTSGERLSAISVYAWPKAYRELSKYYQEHKKGVIGNGKTTSDTAWNASLQPSSPLCETIEQQGERICSVAPNNEGTANQLLQPALLRLGVDESSSLGPRRGPLHSWCHDKQSQAWAC